MQYLHIKRNLGVLLLRFMLYGEAASNSSLDLFQVNMKESYYCALKFL